MPRFIHIEEFISPYLDGELPEEERAQVEAHLSECGSCRQVLQEQQQAEKLIRQYRLSGRGHPSTEMLLAYHQQETISPEEKAYLEHHLKRCETCRKVLEAAAFLEEAGEDLPEMNPAQPETHPSVIRGMGEVFRQHRVIPAAIAVAAVVLIMVLFFSPKQNPYASLAVIDPAPYVMPEMRGEEGDIQEIFRRGMSHYLNADYESALPLLLQAVKAEPDNPQYQFFFGVTLLLTEHYKEGIGHLIRPTVINSAYREEAMWYAALGYLKVGKVGMGKMYLKQLADESGIFPDKAKMLLKRIQKELNNE